MKLLLTFLTLLPLVSLLHLASSKEFETTSTRELEEMKECVDDEEFVFSTEFAGIKDCAWLSKKESREIKYCDTNGFNDLTSKKVKYACRKTCANYLHGEKFASCDEFKDATDDNDSNGEVVSSTKEGKQCLDSPDYDFETEKGTRDCAWLSKKASRQTKYCEGTGSDGASLKKVKFGCKTSCRRFLTPNYLKLLNGCRERSSSGARTAEEECEDDSLSVLDITLTQVDGLGDSEVISSMCSTERREEMMGNLDGMETSTIPCVRKFYEVAHDDVQHSLATPRACKEEVSTELGFLHDLESRRRLTNTGRKLFTVAGVIIGVTIAFQIGNLAASIGKSAGGKRRLRERNDLADSFDFIKGEPFVSSSEMDLHSTKCDLADYEVAVIITPGPHSILGARPLDPTIDCPILAFDAHYSQETKTMFVLHGNQEATGSLRNEKAVAQSESPGGYWGALFKDDPIYPLGSTKLNNVFKAFNATEPLHFDSFHVEKHNCFHFVKNMWRHLNLKEDEGLLNFVVENVVKDKNIGRMLGGIGSSDSSREAVNDEEVLKRYLHEIVSNQLEL